MEILFKEREVDYGLPNLKISYELKSLMYYKVCSGCGLPFLDYYSHDSKLHNYCNTVECRDKEMVVRRNKAKANKNENEIFRYFKDNLERDYLCWVTKGNCNKRIGFHDGGIL